MNILVATLVVLQPRQRPPARLLDEFAGGFLAQIQRQPEVHELNAAAHDQCRLFRKGDQFSQHVLSTPPRAFDRLPPI